MTRQEHYKKYNKDLSVCDIKIRKRTKKPKTNIDELETLCLECWGKKRAKKRTKDFSMTGYHSHKEENKKKLKIRCYHCKQFFYITYNPTIDRRRWLRQKCEYCGELLQE